MTPTTNPTMKPTEDPPMSGSLVRRLALIALPALALAGAWWMTRPSVAPSAPAAEGHDHAAMAAMAGGDSTAVMLTADQARRIGVTYAAVEHGPLALEVRAVGQVLLDETRVQAVTLRYDGWVERLQVDRTGQAVRAGDPLLELYAPMVVSAQEELLLARRLATELGAGDDRAQAGTAELVRSARRRLALWDVPEEEIARLERSGEIARTTTPRASVSGVVLEKSVVAGQRVMAGEVLYRIADLSSVWVTGEVFEQDLRQVALGQVATVEVDALPGLVLRGRVAFIAPTLAPETRTVQVRVELANPGLRLKPGMFATLRLDGAARAAVLSVPRSAVLSTGERTLVFVRLPDGGLAPREVEVGASTPDRVEILRGLAAGETVVASATFLVDAESNLRTALGGMGDMPGMEITTPPAKATPPVRR